MALHERSQRRTPSSLVAARRSARRMELLDAADRAIRRGGPSASMDRIAAEAGIAKPVLYRHFGDKGGLYQALTERYVRALMDELRTALAAQREPRDRLASTIGAYLDFIDRHREAYRFLMNRAVGERPEARAAVTDFIRRVAGEVGAAVREDLERNGMDATAAEPWAHGIVGMVHLAGDWWLEQDSMPRRDLVEHLTDLLWSGFGGIASSQRQVPRDTAEAGY